MDPAHRPRGRRPQRVPDPLRRRVFTVSSATSVGVGKDRLDGPAYRRLHRRVYVESELDLDHRLAAHAWMMALPGDAAMYGRTAATWYGLPVTPCDDFEVIVPPGTVPRRRAGLIPHEGLQSGEATVVHGLRVTTPERTWLDLSHSLDDIDLVVVADAMVRRGLSTPERLAGFADSARGRRGIIRARALARQSRRGVDSPQETRLRLAIIAAGLPCPEANVDVHDDHHGWIGRPDLSYPALKISIQYEGDVHRTNKRRWRADIRRDEILLDHGWEVVRVTADDLERPRRLIDRIQRAMRRQQRRISMAG